MMDWVGLFCHQLPGRSPHCEGEMFPLCFRCAGTALGLCAGFALLLADRRGVRRRLPDLPHALLLSGLMAPLVLDGWANLLGLWATPGWARSLTGVGVGVGLPLLIVPLLQPLEPDATRHLPSSFGGVGSLAAALIPAAGLVLWLGLAPNPTLFHAAAWLAAAGQTAFALTLGLVVRRALAERFRGGPGRHRPAASPS